MAYHPTISISTAITVSSAIAVSTAITIITAITVSNAVIGTVITGKLIIVALLTELPILLVLGEKLTVLSISKLTCNKPPHELCRSSSHNNLKTFERHWYHN